MENQKPVFLSNFGFMLTYKCTIACPHCIVKAGPHRREEMKTSDAFNWLDQIREYHKNLSFPIGISLTGGEPFYNLEQIKQIADYAKKLNFIVSVVTNAFWAESREKAIETLKTVDSIDMISVSTDRYHLESISMENVKNAVFAAKKLGKEYNIAVATESEEDKEHIELMDTLLEITEPDKIQIAFSVPVGRGEHNLKQSKFKLCAEPTEAACSMASFPVIFPDGKVIACIGPPITLAAPNPLYLGNLKTENLKDILVKSENNYLLHAIRTFGPKILVDQLKELGFGALLPDSYISECPCDVCHKLFSNNKIVDALSKVLDNEYFKQKVAYGRYYYLDETTMIEHELAQLKAN